MPSAVQLAARVGQAIRGIHGLHLLQEGPQNRRLLAAVFSEAHPFFSGFKGVNGKPKENTEITSHTPEEQLEIWTDTDFRWFGSNGYQHETGRLDRPLILQQ